MDEKGTDEKGTDLFVMLVNKSVPFFTVPFFTFLDKKICEKLPCSRSIAIGRCDEVRKY